MVVKADERMLARIGFAERWLDRARDQCAEGNLARSVLTLVLADAEVHHALEAVGVPARARTRRPTPMALLLPTALAAALLLALRWPMDSGSVASTPAPPVVRLASTSGALLEAMVPSLQVPAAPQVTTGLAGRAVTAGPVSVRRRTPGAAGQPLEAPRFTRPSGDTSGHLTVGSGSAHISMSELIDLMLTAERVLRREPAGPSSP